MVGLRQFESDQGSFAALRTNGEIGAGEREHQLLPGLGLIGSLGVGRVIAGVLLTDEGTCSLEFCFGVAWGHEAKVPDFDKPCGEYVQEKPADKFRSGDGDESVSVVVLIVSSPEADCLSTEARQSVVGNGYPVGVAAEVGVGLL